MAILIMTLLIMISLITTLLIMIIIQTKVAASIKASVTNCRAYYTTILILQ
jgi:hypothetical protein